LDDLEFYSKFNQEGIRDELEDEMGGAGPSISFSIPTIGLQEDAEEEEIVQKSSRPKEKVDKIRKSAPPAASMGKAKRDGMMVFGLSGVYAGGALPPQKSPERETERPAGRRSKSEVRELLEFLQESINEYSRYVNNIGRNGLAAANLNYYRDDIQEIIDFLKYDDSIKLKEYWGQIVKIDLQLRGKAPIHVREIGYNNFKQYQIVNDPPLTHWWWYLNRIVSPPIEGPKFWEIWKKI